MSAPIFCCWLRPSSQSRLTCSCRGDRRCSVGAGQAIGLGGEKLRQRGAIDADAGGKRRPVDLRVGHGLEQPLAEALRRVTPIHALSLRTGALNHKAVFYITQLKTLKRTVTSRANSHIVSTPGAPQSESPPPQPGRREPRSRQLPRTSGPPCPLATCRGADLARGGGGLRRLAGADLVSPRAAVVAGPATRRLADRLARQPAARGDPRPSDAPALDQRRARHGAGRPLAALSRSIAAAISATTPRST